MKHKDIIVLKKIHDYCEQCEEAVEMFQDDIPALKSAVEKILETTTE